MREKNIDYIVHEMIQIIEKYNYRHNLFGGGCAYAAYLIANACRTLGIQYKTIMYQYKGILEETDFNKAINNSSGVAHVGISVELHGIPQIIGSDAGVRQYFYITRQAYAIRKYEGISPEAILSGYRNNVWNTCYDRRNNGPLTREFNLLVSKYSEIR